MEIRIKDKLYKDIAAYCKINDLDVEEYINNILKKAFMIDKYGEKPGIKPIEKVVEPKKEEKPKKEQKVEVFPQLEDVTIDFSKTEELKPEVPMSHDIDEKTVKKLIEDNIKPPRRKLTKK